MKTKPIFLSFFIALLSVFSLHAELLHSPTWNYTLDLPEGFILSSKKGNDSYQFEHSVFPITIVAKTYPLTRFKNTSECLKISFEQIGAKNIHGTESLNWHFLDSSLASFKIEKVKKKGWAFSSILKDKKGMLLILAFSDESIFESAQNLLLSVIDSLSVDTGSYLQPGPITSYAFPKGDIKTHTVEIEGKKIDIRLSEEASEANAFVIEREYAILSLYATSDAWKSAWQRFYRVIYRDSYKRVQEAAFSIYNTLYPLAKEKNPSNPQFELAQMLLKWSQGFKYERKKTTSDFSSIPSILSGNGSDCDSRSMFLALLLSQMHLNTTIFVSKEYSHAILGIALDAPGAKITVDGIAYLLGETTAPVDLGKIAQSMSNEKHWIVIPGI